MCPGPYFYLVKRRLVPKMKVYSIPHQQISHLKLETETYGVFSCYLLRLYVW